MATLMAMAGAHEGGGGGVRDGVGVMVRAHGRDGMRVRA